MTPVTTKTFKSGNSEAVRLPKDLAFGIGTELVLEKSGEVVTIRPKVRRLPNAPTWTAQARVQEATLATCNGDHFRDIPGLQLLEW